MLFLIFWHYVLQCKICDVKYVIGFPQYQNKWIADVHYREVSFIFLEKHVKSFFCVRAVGVLLPGFKTRLLQVYVIFIDIKKATK